MRLEPSSFIFTFRVNVDSMLMKSDRNSFSAFSPLRPVSAGIPFFVMVLLVMVIPFGALLGQDSQPIKRRDSISFGVQAGLSFSHFVGMNPQHNTQGGQNIVGFRGGVNIDYPVNHFMSLRPEILFTQKGYKIHDAGDSMNIKTRLSYIKVPVNVVFRVCALDHGAIPRDFFNLGIGPYVAYGIHGTYSTESTSTAVKFSNEQLPASSPNYGEYYKHLDAGVNYFAEFELGRFYSQVGGAVGLTNIKTGMENIPAHESVYRNACFNLSYGWRF